MERFTVGRISRAATLLALPFAATISGCRDGFENNATSNDQLLTSVPSETPTTGTRQELIDKAKEKGIGLVFITIEGYKPSDNMVLQLNRVDGDADAQNSLDTQIVNVTSPMHVLGASSCEGEYELSISLDKGETYSPVLQGTTPDKPLSPIFELDEN